jgi:hypothetical protein
MNLLWWKQDVPDPPSEPSAEAEEAKAQLMQAREQEVDVAKVVQRNRERIPKNNFAVIVRQALAEKRSDDGS